MSRQYACAGGGSSTAHNHIIGSANGGGFSKSLWLNQIKFFQSKAIQCTRMLRNSGLLRNGYEMLSQEQESSQKNAEQRANLTQKQRQMLITCTFRAFLCVRLFGKQKWQDFQMRWNPLMLHHLMTKRQMCVIPITIREKPYWTYFSFANPDSVFFHPSGFKFNSRTGWTESFSGCDNMTTHSCKPLIAITSDGIVWIGQNGDSTNLFHVIHVHNGTEENRATTCAFHPWDNFVAVGVSGKVIVYHFSPSSSSILEFQSKKVLEVSFFQEPGYQEPGYFCTLPPKYPPCVIIWNQDGESFVALSGSRGNLSRKFLLKRFESTFEFKSENRYAYLFPYQKEHLAPLCTCMSSDEKFVVTGYSNGKVIIKNVELDPANPDYSKLLRVFHARCSIEKISYPSCDSSILVALSSSNCCNSVHLLKISPDGLTIDVFYSFPGANDFQFYDGMFLLLDGNIITFFRLNGDNLPVRITQFTSKVGHIKSYCLTTLNDVVTLWYSTHRDSKLRKAELTVK